MASYNEAAGGYEYGDSSFWPYSTTSLTIQYDPTSGLAACQFGGIDVLRGNSIDSAHLNLTFSAPTASAIIHAYGVNQEDAALPGSWSTANTMFQDYRSAAHPSFDANGLTSYSLDVTTLITELVAGIGNSLVLLLTQPAYSGESVGNLTASLQVTYTIGGAGDDVGTSGNPSAAWLMFMDA